MKLLTSDIVPCWYELSWDEKQIAILLKVHKDFIDDVKPIPENNFYVLNLMESFKFAKFVGNFEGNFGFDNTFLRKGEVGSFIKFLIKIPQVKIQTSQKCSECRGSGKDDLRDSACLFCKGTGWMIEFDWHLARAISALSLIHI